MWECNTKAIVNFTDPFSKYCLLFLHVLNSIEICLKPTTFLRITSLQVTRQLYEPLVMQLIHWFTNNKKFESQDTVAFLEAILVGHKLSFSFFCAV